MGLEKSSAEGWGGGQRGFRTTNKAALRAAADDGVVYQHARGKGEETPSELGRLPEAH